MTKFHFCQRQSLSLYVSLWLQRPSVPTTWTAGQDNNNVSGFIVLEARAEATIDGERERYLWGERERGGAKRKAHWLQLYLPASSPPIPRTKAKFRVSHTVPGHNSTCPGANSHGLRARKARTLTFLGDSKT